MKKVTLTGILVGIVGMAMHSAVFAYEDYAAEAIYLNAKLLDLEFDSDSQKPTGAFEIEEGYRLELGYRFSENLAFEFGINDFDDAYEKGQGANGLAWKTKTHVDGYTLGLKGFYPLSQRAELWGSVGMFLWDVEWDGTFTSFADFPGYTQSGSYKEEGRNTYFSAGVNFLLSENAYLSVESAFK